MFASAGLKLAEWPEKAKGLLPLPDLRIVIEPDVDADAHSNANSEERRAVQITAHTALGTELLGSLGAPLHG